MTVHESLTMPYPARLSVEDFMVLDKSGAFQAYVKTELIDGTIYVVNAQYSAHMKAKVRLLRRLADACDALRNGMEAWSEGAVTVGPSNMPEPDIFVTTALPDDGPVPCENVALVIEISDTTQAFDLGEKSAVYAAGRIPEYWVVDLKANIVHRKWAPNANGYSAEDKVALGEWIASATIAVLAVETNGLV